MRIHPLQEEVCQKNDNGIINEIIARLNGWE
jgi:hypothetical protein